MDLRTEKAIKTLKNAHDTLGRKTTDISVNIEDVEWLTKLVQRDCPLPARKTDTDGLYQCSVCGGYVHSDESFCGCCGQRIDMENEALA